MIKEGVQKRSYKVQIIIFATLALAAFLVALYTTFAVTPKCESYVCFKTEMQECKKVTYINDAVDATWKYEILSNKNNQCQINVKLLQAKQGELGIDKLQGLSMNCAYPQGSAAYPEKDLEKCHGILKEELQAIVIKKLHTYIIQNLDQVNESLQTPF